MNNNFTDASYSQENEAFFSYINNLSPMNNWLEQYTTPNTYPSIIVVVLFFFLQTIPLFLSVDLEL